MPAALPKALNQVDLAFVVDTTGSMSPFLQTARGHMVGMLKAASESTAQPVDLRVGIVEYRDHPPQDYTFAAKAHAFTDNLSTVRKTIDGLKADGGGDAPETVFDGLKSACEDLQWRPHARRLAVLIGDAPPHDPCTCKLRRDDVTALLETHGILLTAIGLTELQRVFAPLANAAGGDYFTSTAGTALMDSLSQLLRAEFAHLEFDRQVLAARTEHPEWPLEQLAASLSVPRARVSPSLSRLGRRRLLTSSP